MRATLQVTSSPARARRVELRDGQAARFGRSAWADYSFPEDSRLAEIHFAVACFSGGCLLRHLASGQQTFVNRQSVTDVRLRSGDQIVAGQTTWSVTIEGEAIVAPAEPGESRAAPESAPEEKPPETDWPALANTVTGMATKPVPVRTKTWMSPVQPRRSSRCGQSVGTSTKLPF